MVQSQGKYSVYTDHTRIRRTYFLYFVRKSHRAMPSKCSNCKAPDHRGYCPTCRGVFIRVRRWVKKMSKQETAIEAQNTPTFVVYWVADPPKDVREWLEKRGKMPDMEALRNKARLMSVRAAINAG